METIEKDDIQIVTDITKNPNTEPEESGAGNLDKHSQSKNSKSVSHEQNPEQHQEHANADKPHEPEVHWSKNKDHKEHHKPDHSDNK